jgi:GDPmannose 4,6-dehydratase
MLQQEAPEDFVIATGRQHSVRQFLIWAAAGLGIALRFQNSGIDEVGIVEEVSGEDAPCVKPGQVIVRIDPRYFRPAEVESLVGDTSRAREKLGWRPETTVEMMCAEMVREDLSAARRHNLLQSLGLGTPLSRGT